MKLVTGLCINAGSDNGMNIEYSEKRAGQTDMKIRIAELPTSLSHAQGWPSQQDFTDTPHPLISASQSKSAPKISVITPSFNQGVFIEKTIRSVLLQSYPNLEYFVIDGGSTDGTLEVLQRYSPWITSWVSERDRGQSHAINKGFRQATGDIFCWLNSDDYLAPNALVTVAEALHCPSGPQIAFGDCVKVITQTGEQQFVRGEFRGRAHLLADDDYTLHQPSTFWRREVYDRIGGLDETLHLIMDFDYWFRMADSHRFVRIDRVLSYSHFHPAAKTGDNFVQYTRERRRYAKQLVARLRRTERVQYKLLRGWGWLRRLLGAMRARL